MRTHHKFRKFRSFLFQKVPPSASEDSPLVRTGQMDGPIHERLVKIEEKIDKSAFLRVETSFFRFHIGTAHYTIYL